MNARFLLATALACAGPAAAAPLVGSSVTGSASYGGGPNYFDPANGLVPAGFLNSAGTTVTISSSATEFAIEDNGFNFLKADFTEGQLSISDVSSVGMASLQMTFKDSAFVGGSISEVSDSFLNGGATAMLSGDTITVNVPEFSTQGTFGALWNLTLAGANVPDGGSVAVLMGIGVATLAAFRRRLHRVI